MAVSSEETRTRNRRKKHASWWSSKEWRDLVIRETAGKSCEYCGAREGETWTDKKGNTHTVYLTIHHPDSWAYKSLELYLDSNTRKEVVCQRCHKRIGQGMKLCPVCKKNWVNWQSDMCLDCKIEENPHFIEMIEEEKARRKAEQNARRRAATKKRQYRDHPCSRRGLNQKCKGRNVICTFSKKKAYMCLHFREKIRLDRRDEKE